MFILLLLLYNNVYCARQQTFNMDILTHIKVTQCFGENKYILTIFCKMYALLCFIVLIFVFNVQSSQLYVSILVFFKFENT